MIRLGNLGMPLLVLSLTACGPCGNGTDDADGGRSTDAGQTDAGLFIPTVLSTTPHNGSTNVHINASVTATFTMAMDPATLNASTFKVTSGNPAVAVLGVITYSASTVVFRPAANFSNDTAFTATVSTGARSVPGAALPADEVWMFTTGSTVAITSPVDLGTAGNFVVLAKTGISTVPTSVITGDLGVSPAAASFITGFSLVADATNVFSTAAQVTGRLYAADYAPPTPSNMTTAISNMETAFTDAAGRAPDVTELGAGNIAGMTLVPGVYKWGTGLLIPTDVTLTGGGTGVWIFQVAQDLTVSSGAAVHLAGGALSKNVFWQVSGRAELGTTSHLEGVVLSQTAITLATGATVNGRLLAQSAVAMDGNTVVQPAP